MDNDKLIDVANQWFAAFNEQDIDQLLNLYIDEAVHYSPKLKIRQPATNGLIKGKALLRTWWSQAFQNLPTLQYEVQRLTPFENRIFMEYIRHVKGEEDIYVGEMLELKNGKIISSVVFHR